MTRWRRRILRGALALFALLALLVVVALLALAHLDAWPMRGIVTSQAQKRGIALDYDEAGATLGGLHLKNVRVASPPADADLAPALVQIDRIDGRWSPFHKRLDDLVIDGVTITVVVNPDGTTSLDRFLAGLPPSPTPPPVPLSRLLDGLLPEGVAARARLQHVTVRMVPRGAGRPALSLEGLAASATLADGRLSLAIDPEELHLAVGERRAVVRLAGALDVQPPLVTAKLDVDVQSQDLAPELASVKKLLALEARAEFLAGEKRTRVDLGKLALLDRAVDLRAVVDLHDVEPAGIRPVVASANGQIDLAALARAVPPALGPMTVTAPKPITVSAENLELAPPRGKLLLDGEIERIAMRDLEAAGLVLHATADPAGVAHLELAAARLEQPGLRAGGVTANIDAVAAADTRSFPVALKGRAAVAELATPAASVADVKLTLAGTVRGPRALDLDVTADAARVGGPAAVDGAHVELGVKNLTLAEPPLASTGELRMTARLERVVQGPRRAAGVELTARAKLAGKAPAVAGVTLDAATLDVPGVGRGPAHVELEADPIHLDAAHPGASSADARLAARFAGVEAHGTASASAAAQSWDLTAKADRLGPARAVTVSTKGTIGATIQHDTRIDTGAVATASATLRAAHLHVTSSGTPRRQEGHISAALDGLSVGGADAGSPKLEIDAKGGLDPLGLDVRLRGQAPAADVHLTAGLEKGPTVRWQLDGHLGGLAALAPLLPAGVDYTRLTADVKGGGTVAGVITAIDQGVPVLAADPLAAARGKQELTLAVKNVHLQLPDERSADVDAVSARATVDLGRRRTAVVDVDIPTLAVAASGVHLAGEGLSAHLDASADAHGAGTAALAIKAKALRQSAYPGYVVKDTALDVAVEGDPRAVVQITAHLANPGGGTALQLSGGVDRRTTPGGDAVPGRRSFWLDGALDQSLDALAGDPALAARGKISIPFRVESGDLALFRASARLKLADVTLSLPKRGITVAGVRGEVPLVEEILVGEHGALAVGRAERDRYPQLRFADQQPFLGGADYLTVASIQVGDKKLGPLAANVRLDRDVIALDQLELAALGGKITGQCAVVVAGLDTSLSFRGKITGVQSSAGEGERLDANAALTLAPYRLGLDGRVEIVAIGKGHLRDLLDVFDPYHADVASNRVRLALNFGYPKQVRLHFSNGFASFAVELGGLAGAVRIDEIQGVPIGPILAEYLGPYLEMKK